MRKKVSKEKLSVVDRDDYESWADRERLTVEETYLYAHYVETLDRDAALLDVGTGGGRFVFELWRRGFRRLHGIDISTRLLQAARDRALREGVTGVQFLERSATDSGLPDATFDAVVALQQVTSLVGGPTAAERAVGEYFRVLRPGGLLLASALHYAGRRWNPLLSAAVLPLKLLKREFGALDPRCLPQLRFHERLNRELLWSKQPYLYWFGMDEFRTLIARHGFEILELQTSRSIREGLPQARAGGMLFIAARKPARITKHQPALS
jgi:SAM-dependent methyltransferase